MDLFTIISQTEDSIVVKPVTINIDDYRIERNEETGIITYKKIKEVSVSKITDLDDIDLTFSKLIECKINDVDVDILAYRPLLIHVYRLIGDGVKIIKALPVSNNNIRIGLCGDKGYTYLEDLGFSFHGKSAHNTMKEILHHCEFNEISIDCRILLQ